MNRSAKLKRGQFYREISGTLILAISATTARIVCNGHMLTSLRDWNISGGPWSTFEAVAHWTQYQLADLIEWRDRALELGTRPWQRLGGCTCQLKEKQDDPSRSD